MFHVSTFLSWNCRIILKPALEISSPTVFWIYTRTKSSVSMKMPIFSPTSLLLLKRERFFLIFWSGLINFGISFKLEWTWYFHFILHLYESPISSFRIFIASLWFIQFSFCIFTRSDAYLFLFKHVYCLKVNRCLVVGP